jgi:phage terminase small subunit
MTRELANIVEVPPDPNDRAYDGKTMSALTARKRKFVICMLQQGVNPKAASRAATEAGYQASYGYELMRDPAILAALREEATKRVAGAGLVGINVLLDIAHTPGHKDQFRAAKELAGINGFTTEQRIVVEHISEDSKQQLRQIREMAEQMGMDPRQLIAAAGIVDAEFEDVTPAKPAEVDDSDW